jgi:hypothetical protein
MVRPSAMPVFVMGLGWYAYLNPCEKVVSNGFQATMMLAQDLHSTLLFGRLLPAIVAHRLFPNGTAIRSPGHLVTQRIPQQHRLKFQIDSHAAPFLSVGVEVLFLSIQADSGLRLIRIISQAGIKVAKTLP